MKQLEGKKEEMKKKIDYMEKGRKLERIDEKTK